MSEAELKEILCLRNTSVDSEGYSLKPNEEMNNRESGTSFYSSSEDESADEETNKFNSSSGSTLKFSIRPPSVNLAPSMDDLSTTAKNLTLEKSPRMPRKGLSTEVNNDSSASLSTMNTEDKRLLEVSSEIALSQANRKQAL